MRNLSELNINIGGKPVGRLAPTEELFASFESETGLILPLELRELLLFSNGGHPELDGVGGKHGQYAVSRFHHLHADDRDSESLWYAVKHWRPYLGEFALPFASTGGGDQFFLDLSTQPACVKLCRHDEAMRIVYIAPSFENFIDSLEIDPDML